MLIKLIILYFVVLALHAAYFLRRLLYLLQMLQLNSYFSGRFLRWFWNNRSSVFALREGLPFLVVSTIVFEQPMVRLVMLGLIYIELLLSFNSSPAKKPLIFTARVLRLLSLNLFFVGGIYFVLTYLGWKLGITGINYAILVLVNLTVWVPFILLGTNFLIAPLEKFIQFWYILDARRFLKKLTHLEVIGITGSYGKTTTKYILYELLKEGFYTLKTPGSYNTLMGVTKIIRTRLRSAHEKFIVEMSAKQEGDIDKLCNLIQPRYGLVTVIGEQHLETFKTLAKIQKTKGELFRSLPENGVAFLNADDPNSLFLIEQVACRVVSFGLEKPADFQITSYTISAEGSQFILRTKGRNYEFSTSLLGKANLYDLCAAIAVAATSGIAIEAMKNPIKHLIPPPHRLELKKVAPEIWYLDDAFNSNPIGSTNALEVLKQFSHLRKIIVTPGMVELGSKEEEYNYHFGSLIAEICDHVILVGKTQTLAIQRALHQKDFNFQHCFIANSFSEAKQYLEHLLKPRDIVLFENDLPDTYL